jgi:pyruvate/2-oxoglutarate/acetoin dehydrogenase E1 component
MLRVTPPDIPALPAAAMEHFYMPNVDKIVAAMEQAMRY